MLIITDTIGEALLKLAKKKVQDIDYLYPEHLIHAVYNVTWHLLLIFNAWIVHGCVSDTFTCTVVFPVIKYKVSDLSKLCRLNSLVAILRQVKELFYQETNAKQMFDPLQYRFINGEGCRESLLTVDCIVNYFICRGSPTYMVAYKTLYSKTLDRINHYSLFLAWMKFNILLLLLKSFSILASALERYE